MSTGRIFGILVFAAIGLAIGYALFGKWSGEYVSVQTLFSFDGSPLQKAFRSLAGFDDMRNRILLSGAAGAVIGVFIPLGQKK